jgi:hypothetical protein
MPHTCGRVLSILERQKLADVLVLAVIVGSAMVGLQYAILGGGIGGRLHIGPRNNEEQPQRRK